MQDTMDRPAFAGIRDETEMLPELGDHAKDGITGFEGIVMGRGQWLHGPDRIIIQPTRLDRDGKPVSEEHFDIGRIEVMKRGLFGARMPEGQFGSFLGKVATDSVTQFKGTITGIMTYLSGRVMVFMETSQRGRDGAPLDLQGFDAGRVQIEGQ